MRSERWDLVAQMQACTLARNQFDYYRSVPGGLSGLANVTAEFHRRGVRVLWGNWAAFVERRGSESDAWAEATTPGTRRRDRRDLIGRS